MIAIVAAAMLTDIWKMWNGQWKKERTSWKPWSTAVLWCVADSNPSQKTIKLYNQWYYVTTIGTSLYVYSYYLFSISGFILAEGSSVLFRREHSFRFKKTKSLDGLLLSATSSISTLHAKKKLKRSLGLNLNPIEKVAFGDLAHSLGKKGVLLHPQLMNILNRQCKLGWGWHPHLTFLLPLLFPPAT